MPESPTHHLAKLLAEQTNTQLLIQILADLAELLGPLVWRFLLHHLTRLLERQEPKPKRP
jgi:hypothetical protein